MNIFFTENQKEFKTFFEKLRLKVHPYTVDVFAFENEALITYYFNTYVENHNLDAKLINTRLGIAKINEKQVYFRMFRIV